MPTPKTIEIHKASSLIIIDESVTICANPSDISIVLRGHPMGPVLEYYGVRILLTKSQADELINWGARSK